MQVYLRSKNAIASLFAVEGARVDANDDATRALARRPPRWAATRSRRSRSRARVRAIVWQSESHGPITRYESYPFIVNSNGLMYR